MTTEFCLIEPATVPARARWYCRFGFHRRARGPRFTGATETSAGEYTGRVEFCLDCRRVLEELEK
jgi:hypothetical protein